MGMLAERCLSVSSVSPLKLTGLVAGCSLWGDFFMHFCVLPILTCQCWQRGILLWSRFTECTFAASTTLLLVGPLFLAVNFKSQKFLRTAIAGEREKRVDQVKKS